MVARTLLVGVPALCIIWLVSVAAGEDDYAGTGDSHWQTHPDERPWVVAALLLNGFAIAAAVVARGTRVHLAIAALAAAFAVLMSGCAALGISAN